MVAETQKNTIQSTVQLKLASCGFWSPSVSLQANVEEHNILSQRAKFSACKFSEVISPGCTEVIRTDSEYDNLKFL